MYVFTANTTVPLPDLRAFGLTFHRGTSYVWQVHDWEPFASVDEIAGPTWFVPQGDGSEGASTPRQFNFAR